MNQIVNQLSGWTFLLSAVIIAVLIFRAYSRFISSRSFANFAWATAYLSLATGMVLIGLSRLIVNSSFEIIAFIFLFEFAVSSLWVLFNKGTYWGIGQKSFALLLSIIPWIVFIVFPENSTEILQDMRSFFIVLSTLAVSIYYITWFFSFIVSRHSFLEMRMSVSLLPFTIACWLPLFVYRPSIYLVISILFLLSSILVTYTWVKHAQKTD
jgi:hypothetical protein